MVSLENPDGWGALTAFTELTEFFSRQFCKFCPPSAHPAVHSRLNCVVPASSSASQLSLLCHFPAIFLPQGSPIFMANQN
jgi:hypothetical protein